ncbi:AraC family transcriptional regulator [Marinomonas sp. THO17]|uniref:helix-turn-helix domain-containing protein n=1 Tax=Marinomonas sp. THO17 TaxID=3149048 RepID=UPI00336BF353
MNTVDTIEAIFASAVLGQCLLTISLLIVKKDPLHIYAPLIVFFTAIFINSLSTTIDILPFDASSFLIKYTSTVFGFICLLLLFPFLWFYIRNITSPVLIEWRKQDIYHLIPFIIGLGVATLLLSLPVNMMAMLFDENAEGPVTWLLEFAAWSLYLLMILWAIQCLCYFTVFVRHLVRHKQQLKHYFSSTEDRELMWIYVVSVLMITTLMVSWVGMFTDYIDQFEYLVDILVLCFVFTLSHWSLRQGSFMQETAFADLNATEESAGMSSIKSPAKYEKSALTEAHIDRIEQNIHKVMQEQQLYLNPNLSLSDLSKAVAEPANYVSQTLNGRLGDTFFDFINALRIKEALKLIGQEEKTVLDIAYEVGFNSRSSFYKAFKRETGLTPTAYKQSLQPS